MKRLIVFQCASKTAFSDLGDEVTLKSMQAFILLRQSCLSNEDKKRVLSMTNGKLDMVEVDKSMRALSTKVLFGSGSDARKKIYPTNFVEPEDQPEVPEDPYGHHHAFTAQPEDEDIFTIENLEEMAANGDADALVMQQFEREFEEAMQEIPELHQALVSYQEARARISERRKSRGFWPVRGGGFGKGKRSGKDSFHRGPRKGGARSGKDELLARIARTRCRNCGALGHWKAECPNPTRPRDSLPKEQANFAVDQDEPPAHVIFEEVSEPEDQPSRCAYEDAFTTQSGNILSHATVLSLQHFWGKRLNNRKGGNAFRNKRITIPSMTNKMPNMLSSTRAQSIHRPGSTMKTMSKPMQSALQASSL